MQLACSSAMFDHLFMRGDVTQLEWVDLAARSLPVEGLVFELRHFPRRDDEYVAEVRKLCVDRSLTIVALASDDLFAQEPETAEAIFAFAAALGAPLLLTDPPLENAEVPAYAWREAAGRGKHAARLAKRFNITIAVRNSPATLCPGVAELKRLTKDIDSSWVRFAPDISSLAVDEILTLRARSVALTSRSFSPPPPLDRKGFLILETRSETLTAQELCNALRLYAQQCSFISLT